MSVQVHVLHRGRFYEIPSATAARVGANAWSIAIPLTDPIHQRTKRAPTAEGWDEAVFLVDGIETQPGVGSGEDGRAVTVSAVIL